MKNLIFIFYSILIISGCCSGDCCEAEIAEVERLNILLENNANVSPIECLGDQYLKVYVLHSGNADGTSKNVLFGIYHNSPTYVPVFTCNVGDVDDISNFQHNDVYYIKLRETSFGNLQMVAKKDDPPIIYENGNPSRLKLTCLDKYTVDMYHQTHNPSDHWHRKGHKISSSPQTQGGVNGFLITFYKSDINGNADISREETNWNSQDIHENDLFYEVQAGVVKIVDRYHYPHPPQ